MSKYLPKAHHVLFTLVNAEGLDDAAYIIRGLKYTAVSIGAEVLHKHAHDFGDGLGVTAFLVLAESHISIHTWPEHKRGFVDICTCGDSIDPMEAVGLMTWYFDAEAEEVTKIDRGTCVPDSPVVAYDLSENETCQKE